MQNPLRYGVISLIAAGSLLVSPHGASAQPLQPPVVRSLDDQAGPTLSVQFPGGTVQAYVEALQAAAAGKPVNVVITSEAMKVELSPITLRDVSLFTALQAISAALEGGAVHGFYVGRIGSPADAAFVVAYQQQPEPKSPFPDDGRRVLQVYSIRDLIDPPAAPDRSAQAKVRYEDILSAVDAAMGLVGDKKPPQILFHKETGLLLVGGTGYQTSVVGELLKNIRDDLRSRWSEERDAKRKSADQARQALIARSELEIAQQELAVTKTKVDRLKQLVDAGTSPKDDMAQAQLDLMRAEGNVRRKELELRAIMEQTAGDAGGEGKSIVVYNISDLMDRDPNAVDTIRSLAGSTGVKIENDANTKSIIVRGDAKQQESIKSLLETLRKRQEGKNPKK